MLVPCGEHPSHQPAERSRARTRWPSRRPTPAPGHPGGALGASLPAPPRRRGRTRALERESPLEAGIRDRERCRVRFMELDVVVPLRTLCGHREHVRADVHADDRAVGSDRLEQLGDVETRAAAHIEHAVAGSCAERSAHQLAPAQHVARRVEPLQPLDEAPIELQLAHGPTLPARSRNLITPWRGQTGSPLARCDAERRIGVRPADARDGQRATQVSGLAHLALVSVVPNGFSASAWRATKPRIAALTALGFSSCIAWRRPRSRSARRLAAARPGAR